MSFHKRTVSRTISLIVCLVLLCTLGATGCSDTSTEPTDESAAANEVTSSSGAASADDSDVVVLEINDGGTIEIQLDSSQAPKTVENFKELVSSGFYDGTTFHRVIEGFMIQGGDPTGTGSGGPGYTIEGEFESNGYSNTISHERGVVSMARSNDPDSAGSQFFIVQQAAPHLDGDYAAFGYVIDGMDEVDRIAAVDTDANDKPLEDVVIERAYLLSGDESDASASA